MKKKLRIVCTLALLVCMLTGGASADGIFDYLGALFRVGLLNSITETEAAKFNQPVDAFFEALDAKDAEGIRALFAPAVLEAQPDMDAQIEKLFAVYPGVTELCLRDGPGESGHSRETGKRESYIRKRFPVKSDGNEFVCQVHLIYENDWDESQIGLQQVVLMNLDTAYRFANEDSTRSSYPQDIGLHVLTDYDSGLELRFVERHVQRIKIMDRQISKTELLDFCADEANHSYPALLEAFGEPNDVEDNSSFLMILYELESENGEKRYFKAFVDADSRRLSSASIVGEFKWISKVIEEQPEA